MYKIMAVNAGSSSLKFQLLNMPEESVITEGIIERIGFEDAIFTIKFEDKKDKSVLPIKDHTVAVDIVLKKLLSLKVVADLNEIDSVGHRIVHGVEKFSSSCLIDDAVLKGIRDCNELAPLHNPANLIGYEAFNKALPNINAVAVFDTAFHQTLKPENYLYAVPLSWYKEHKVRKYGFHGTSHLFVSDRAKELLGSKDAKVIVCHLGNGASISAVGKDGCIDTSMGMTPLAGLMMGTRSGDIDPAIISYIADKTNQTLSEVTSDLNKKSGLLGVSEKSSDARDIEDGIAAGDKNCILAFDIYYKKIVDYIASYYVQLGGADAICFTAGLGENAALCRSEIIKRLSALGIKIDEKENNVRGKEKLISTSDSSTKVYIIPTNEELVIARDTMKFFKK